MSGLTFVVFGICFLGRFLGCMSQAPSCPGGWIQFGFSCYLFPADQLSSTWDGARTSCMGSGGDLVSIQSAEENSFVFSLAVGASDGQYNVWIGFVDNGDGFTWADGSEGSYTNWAPGEPNYGWELHTELIVSRKYVSSWDDAVWNDSDGGLARNGYVCETEIPRSTRDISAGGNIGAGSIPGYLQSPNYPSNYGNDIDQTVTITAAAGMVVHINIEAFNLESHSSCAYDDLTLTDSGAASVTFCGTQGAGYDYTSAGNVMTVAFHTDYSVTGSGFSLLYEAIAADGSLRLADGTTDLNGRVEVNYGGEWGVICDDAFTMDDGDAFCRFMGFSGCAAIHIGANGYEQSEAITLFGDAGMDDWAIVLDDVACSAGAADLAACYGGSINWNSHNCIPSEAVGLTCSGIRLINNGNVAESEGRVEIYYDGDWGIVCDDDFGQEDGDAFCRFLGFTSASELLIAGGGYGTSTSVAAFGEFGPSGVAGNILVDDAACDAASTSIEDCFPSGRTWGDHNCQNQEAVGLRCV